MNDLIAPSGWHFIAAAAGTAQGRVSQEGDSPALAIEHTEYVEGSRWEQIIAGVPAGTLLTLTGRARSRGQCLRKTGQNMQRQDVYRSGIGMALEALAGSEASGWTSLESVDHVFPFLTANPDGTMPAEGISEGALELVAPEGAEGVRVSVALSGLGTVSFSSLTLVGEAMDKSRMNDRLVDRMKASGEVRSPAVEQAFRAVPRHHFLPGQNWGTAYRDDAIVTHHADGTEEAISSSSQPTMMAIMLEQLQVEPGMRVLEIGAGTGYNAALLSKLTGDPALVWTVDVTEEFCTEARAHLRSAGVKGVHVVCADGWDGCPEATSFDRIIVTASAHDIAPAWREQLAEGGRLVVPWGAPNTQQRCLTFRREGSRLIMDGLHVCGFMRMRGALEWTPSEAASHDWNDWLFPGQPEGEPTSLIAYPSGAAPAPGEGEHLVHRRWFDYVVAWGGS